MVVPSESDMVKKPGQLSNEIPPSMSFERVGGDIGVGCHW